MWIWTFATNSDFLIPVSLQPNGLHHQVQKIKGWEILILLQRLKFFIYGLVQGKIRTEESVIKLV